jgi:gamma-glutamylcyclotransferase (GGCT)/AIG2-like uncharacterized protein YtfP
MTTETMPVFVYGTLRPGWGNAALWAGRADAHHDGAATVTGFALVSGGAFPFAIPDAGSTTVGALIQPHADHYDAVLTRMDQLEGYPHFYDRIMVVVDTPDGITKAWIYTPTEAERFGDMPAVPGNDWTAAHPERATR